MSDRLDIIRSFIIENFLFDEDENVLSVDDSFLESGIIDSTGVLELIEWLEETFNIKIDDEELTPDNLDSINKVSGFIERKIKD